MGSNLSSPDDLGLQLPEVLARTVSGVGFGELKSQDIWGPQVLEPLTYRLKIGATIDILLLDGLVLSHITQMLKIR